MQLRQRAYPHDMIDQEDSFFGQRSPSRKRKDQDSAAKVRQRPSERSCVSEPTRTITSAETRCRENANTDTA